MDFGSFCLFSCVFVCVLYSFVCCVFVCVLFCKLFLFANIFIFCLNPCTKQNKTKKNSKNQIFVDIIETINVTQHLLPTQINSNLVRAAINIDEKDATSDETDDNINSESELNNNSNKNGNTNNIASNVMQYPIITESSLFGVIKMKVFLSNKEETKEKIKKIEAKKFKTGNNNNNSIDNENASKKEKKKKRFRLGKKSPKSGKHTNSKKTNYKFESLKHANKEISPIAMECETMPASIRLQLNEDLKVLNNKYFKTASINNQKYYNLLKESHLNKHIKASNVSNNNKNNDEIDIKTLYSHVMLDDILFDKSVLQTFREIEHLCHLFEQTQRSMKYNNASLSFLVCVFVFVFDFD